MDRRRVASNVQLEAIVVRKFVSNKMQGGREHNMGPTSRNNNQILVTPILLFFNHQMTVGEVDYRAGLVLEKGSCQSRVFLGAGVTVSRKLCRVGSQG